MLPTGQAVAALIAELGQARITATVVGDGVVEEFEDRTVALLTYGLPGFAVDATGALHASLLRSCTGWPSGIWIDPPRRTAPDGSAFQLQHWTHEFRYALTSGDGDWRKQQLPSRGQEFSSPLLAATTTAHDGTLPPTHSLLQVTPERDVLVSTLKPAGNPIARGSGVPADPRDGVTVRLIEATGLGATATVTSALPITGAHHADLLENRGAPIDVADGNFTVDLPGSAVDTFVLGLDHTEPANPAVLGQPAELAQPSYARYWLHNRGPAQLGFLPVSLSVSPTVARTAGKPFELSMVIANQYADSPAAGLLTIQLPDGWTTDQSDRQLHLEPGGYVRHLANVTPPENCEPGQYFVAARVLTHTDDLAGGAGVTAVEDVVTVFVGESPELTATLGFGMPPTEAPDHGSGAADERARPPHRPDRDAVDAGHPAGTWYVGDPRPGVHEQHVRGDPRRAPTGIAVRNVVLAARSRPPGRRTAEVVRHRRRADPCARRRDAGPCVGAAEGDVVRPRPVRTHRPAGDPMTAALAVGHGHGTVTRR